MTSYFPELCPLDKTRASALKCAPCCYCQQNKFANIMWCQIDRVDRNLPDVKL